MEAEGLSEDVLRFLLDRIESVPHLEALLLMWQSPQASWTREEMATRLYVAPEAAAQLMGDLARHGLVTVGAESPPVYRYAAEWDEGGLLMPKIAATYSRQLVRVAQLLHSKASPGVREFARAFQIKKDRS
jgi:predicted ArsR family transcriptional regulator